MKKEMHKLFWVWEFQKEEKWLNEMAAKGLVLSHVHYLTYEFDDASPKDYVIRFELLKNAINSPESQKYIEFMEEMGAEYLGHVLNWAYFRKPKESGAFEIYSDYESRVKYLNRVMWSVLPLGFLNLYFGVYNFWIANAFDNTPNYFFGTLSLILGLTILWGSINIYRIKRNLQKESELFE